MKRGAVLTALACALLAALPMGARALEMPAAARLLSERVSPLDSYALPLGPFDGSAVPVRGFEGRVARRTWRIEGTSATTLQLLQPLRAQLEAEGYAVVYECRAKECGGFDFRYGTEVAPAPQMHVNIGGFRFLSAERGEGEALSLLISRSGSSAYLQEIHVSPAAPEAGAAPEPAPAPDPTEGPAVVTETPGSGLIDRLLAQGHVVLTDLDFVSGAGTLGAGPYDSLAQIAAFLSANPEDRVIFVGHSDSVGALEANMSLSRLRAQSVRDRLISAYGADPARVSAEGVGYLAPVAPNMTPEGREQNRRVEAVLLQAG